MYTRGSALLSKEINRIITDKNATLGAFFKTPFSKIIEKLFANNEQGFAYDPNDLSTMFQDAAGTVPVTGAGQAVGLVLDKSGRNNHAFQTNSASRPILRKNAVTGANYLEFDGSDDFLVTNSIDFTSTDEVSLFAGLRKLSDAASGIVVELGVDSLAISGSFSMFAPAANGVNKFQVVSRGSTGTALGLVASGYGAPYSAVVAGLLKISTPIARLRINSVTVHSATTSQGAGNYSKYPLYIGRRAGTSLPFNGHIYSLIGIGRLTTDAETTALEKLIAKNTGVTLSV